MNTGERKVRELIAKFGADTLRQGMSDLLDYAEHQGARDPAIDAGRRVFLLRLRRRGRPGRLSGALAVTLRIEGDPPSSTSPAATRKLTSSLNVPTGGNPHHTLMLVGVYYILYSLNSQPGAEFRPDAAVPLHPAEGTVGQSAVPCRVGMRSLTCGRIRSLLFGAFGQAMPERMPAAPAGSSSIVNVMTHDDRTARR